VAGRQGIALRPHSDDISSLSIGNFQALLQLRVDAGDEVLRNHLTTCARNATYTSSISQNDLILCIKEYLQSEIVQELKAQAIGPYFGIQCDEVTDSSNWEQLGIVRYVKNFTPVERLLQFVACENITGEELCGHIVKSLEEARLGIQMCRLQIYDYGRCREYGRETNGMCSTIFTSVAKSGLSSLFQPRLESCSV